MTTSNAPPLESLEPKPVWQFFSRMAAVPRPSKKEERICESMKTWAKELGLPVRTDAARNIIIEAPASPGCENAPITVLQAHVDMVCEQNSGTGHDFDNEGIRLLVGRDANSDEVIVHADGTTLGADNGIGVAMALSAAIDPTVKHGPLELVFTTDEESGMTGAKALTPKSFTGRRMLNLDAEEDDVLYIGCAGGCDSTLTFDLEAAGAPPKASVWRVAVSGLRGGHSGADIHLERANAIKLLANTLGEVGPKELQLVSINGGQLRNAIPREATAVVCGPAKLGTALEKAAGRNEKVAVSENGDVDACVQVTEAPGESTTGALSAADTQRVLNTLLSLPHGVLGMAPGIPGLVETSNNVATAKTHADGETDSVTISIGNLARSSSEIKKAISNTQIAAIGRLAGATVETANDYPGWKPNIDSPLAKTCGTVYERLFGAKPTITAIHAGVECGIVGERVGNMDMISLGPRIEGAHTPDERVYVESVRKSWKYLVAILAELASG